MDWIAFGASLSLYKSSMPIRPKRGRPVVIAGLGVDLPDLQRARALWQQNRFDESVSLFEKTARAHPQNLVALVDASRALGARFEIARAEQLLDRLVKIGANRPDLLHLAGQSYRMIFRPEKAMDCFRQALAKTKAIPDAQLELAVLYERRHRVEEALSLIEDCLRGAPDYLEAQLFKGRLLRRMKDQAAAESIFRALASIEDGEPAVRAQAWAELAQAHDRRGEYDDAMRSMLRCKALMLAAEGPFKRESDAVLNQLTAICRGVTGGHFKKWADEGRAFPRRRVAALASFPRSGTTLIEQALDSHPDLVSSDEREAFARDIFPAMWLSATTRAPSVEALDSAPMQRLSAQRDRYLDYMAAALQEAIGGRIHLDKNPTLTLLLPAFLRLFPEASLLIALRDPRDVVVSCFMQYLPLNTNSVCYLTLERAARRYANDMAVWRDLRDKISAAWLELRYENCVGNLESEIRRCLEFLGLPWAPEVMNYRQRLKEKAVSSPTYEAVSQPLYTSAIGRWRHYQSYLEPCLEILAPSIAAFGY